jgi:photosystem II PsbZ protein
VTCENPLTAWSGRPANPFQHLLMQIINTLTVLALVVMSFALIVAIPVLYASSEDSGRSNRLILIGGAAWVALVLLNWGVSFFVV